MSNVTLWHGDCLEEMKRIEDQSIDAIIADIPYGTTACKWDTVIPFEPMWAQLKRIIKPKGAIVLFGSQPFTSALVMSNVEWFKYEWIWKKDKPTNPLNASHQPMKYHENIIVFCEGKTTYNPIMDPRDEKNKRNNAPRMFQSGVNRTCIGLMKGSNGNGDFIYPNSVRNVSMQRGLHPTQKPVALLEYLIKTYTHEGETVLDFTFGSCTTGIACMNTGRNFIGIEKDMDYFKIGLDRVTKRKGEIESTLFSYGKTGISISSSLDDSPDAHLETHETELYDEQV